MRAVELQQSFSIDSLQVVQQADPVPAFGQVLLRMKAWSLNFRDLMLVRGQYNPKLKFPFVPLSDGVGEVVAVGPGVTSIRTGTRVCPLFMQQWHAGQLNDSHAKSALGGAIPGILSEYVILDATGVIPVPEHLSDAEAATLPCAGVTAWNAVISSGQLQPGKTLLVQGTGGVSLFALQFAKLAGVNVIATSGSDEKLTRVKAMGAEHGINYRTQPDWDVAVRELTQGVGVDHVVEVGGSGTLSRSLKSVRAGGAVSMIGVLSGVGGDISLLPILMKNIRIQGIFVGNAEMFATMNQAISLHRMHPVVDRVFKMDAVRDAFQHLASGQHFGKVVIEP
ncbi:MAG: alcohol dehydrogenase [Planctomycetaceae bacterium]|nr:alcohol dehydrogenase [Planctomycetaceae bacterium]